MTPAPARYRVNILRMQDGERFALLVDPKTRLPDPFVTRYAATHLRSKTGSINSMARSLRCIGAGLEWTEARGIDLTQRIDSCDLFTQEETTDLVNWLRLNRSPLSKAERRAILSGKAQRAANDGDKHRHIVDPQTHYIRALEFRAYISWRTASVIQRISVRSGHYGDAIKKLAAWETMITGQVRTGESKTRYGLKPKQRQRFLEVIHPDHPDNPFVARNRHRNHALLLMYYELGVRRAEPLITKGQDLVLVGADPSIYIHRRPDDPDDPRPNEPLVKTADRLLPLDEDLKRALEIWIINHRADRRRYPHAKRTPYVFVVGKGRPMALSTVYDMFVRIRDTFPEIPRDFSPHTLRHDWNDRFSNYCDVIRKREIADGVHPDLRTKRAKEILMRNYLMGWKKHSTRAVTYTNRTIEEQSREILLQLQKRMFA